jgi:hypothetical protein
MQLMHTLLFLIREKSREEDLSMMDACLKSLERSAYPAVAVYNQGCLTNEEVARYLARFQLDVRLLGTGENTGTTVGRQSCFTFIWENMPDVQYITEIHPDMVFPAGWEEPLIEYLQTHDEPMVSCGIIDKDGKMPFLEKTVSLPGSPASYGEFLLGLRQDALVHGFTVPCVHVSGILRETGGYNPAFLKGKQCFEDDSMLLGYYYYYGTRRQWRPTVNYNSVVYHAVAGQRMDMTGSVLVNFNGLVRQYGAMGLKHLSALHSCAWHRRYFKQQSDALTQH